MIAAAKKLGTSRCTLHCKFNKMNLAKKRGIAADASGSKA